MKLYVAVCIAVCLWAVPASAQKVYLDYDEDYPFGSTKSFAWKSTPETSLEESNPLLHAQIVKNVMDRLTQAGLVEDTASPDIYVTYHTRTREKLSVNTTDFGYGYPMHWRAGGYYGVYGRYGYAGYPTSTTSVSTYSMGTLVIDAWDRESGKLVWRGAAADITISDNPERMRKRVDKAIAKIADKWRRLRKKKK